MYVIAHPFAEDEEMTFYGERGAIQFETIAEADLALRRLNRSNPGIWAIYTLHVIK